MGFKNWIKLIGLGILVFGVITFFSIASEMFLDRLIGQ